MRNKIWACCISFKSKLKQWFGCCCSKKYHISPQKNANVNLESEPEPEPEPVVIQNPKTTLAYWNNERARLQANLERYPQDTGRTTTPPQDSTISTPSFSKYTVMKSQTMRELEHVEKMIFQLTGSVYT